MPRHSATDSPVRVAGWVWAALVAVIVVAALVVGWFALAGRDGGDGDSTAADCIEGDAELTVWVDPAATETAEALVDDYNSSDPVVRDRCVTAVVEEKSTAEATAAYRAGQPGVAPVWIPAGTGFIPGLSGAPEEVPVVGTDTLIHYVPEGADEAAADVQNAVVPSGPASMTAALAADAAGVEVTDPGPPLQEALDDNLPVLSAESLVGQPGVPVGDVQFPLVAFGSSPSVDEQSARAAADFASSVTEKDTAPDGDGATVVPEPASPALAGSAGRLAGVDLG